MPLKPCRWFRNAQWRCSSTSMEKSSLSPPAPYSVIHQVNYGVDQCIRSIKVLLFFLLYLLIFWFLFWMEIFSFQSQSNQNKIAKLKLLFFDQFTQAKRKEVNWWHQQANCFEEYKVPHDTCNTGILLGHKLHYISRGFFLC